MVWERGAQMVRSMPVEMRNGACAPQRPCVTPSRQEMRRARAREAIPPAARCPRSHGHRVASHGQVRSGGEVFKKWGSGVGVRVTVEAPRMAGCYQPSSQALAWRRV